MLDWHDPLLVPCHWQAELFYCRWRTKAIDDCSNSNYATDILTLKRFEICRQLLSFLTLCLCEPGVNTTFRVLNLDWLYWQMLTLNSSTIFLWPIWLFILADMVFSCGWCGCGRYGLWPIWYRPVSAEPFSHGTGTLRYVASLCLFVCWFLVAFEYFLQHFCVQFVL